MATTMNVDNTSLIFLARLMTTIIAVRTTTYLLKHREFVYGFVAGAVIIGVIAMLSAPAPQLSTYEQPSPSPAVPIANTDTEIIDTELNSMIGGLQKAPITLNFTGRMIATNEPVNTFECSFNNEGYKGCTSPFTIGSLVAGNYTFEVRSVLQNGTKDPSPAAAIWSVQ